MLIAKTLSWYKRREVQDALVLHAQDREIAVRYTDFFGKRPDVLLFAGDVLEHAKQRATSFHSSEERWRNPMQISTGMSRADMDSIRIGWDLVLDIDCAIFEYSRIAAYYTIEALKHHGIKGLTCKFSGNKGFHIGVPFECFPSTIQGIPTKDMFPEAPRRIAAYVKHLIESPVANAIMELEGGDLGRVIRRSEKPASEIVHQVKGIPHLNVEPFLEIDTILISPRHLYRMPYSLHEKSGLVSLPIDIDKVLSFERTNADPEIAVVGLPFLSRSVQAGEASVLITQAFDFKPTIESEVKSPVRVFEDDGEMIPEQCFPPCIKRMLAGVDDGRKRALFVLLNFYRSCNWPIDRIETELRAWNERNREPLRETVLVSHMRYHLGKKEKTLPPNCSNEMYYGQDRSCRDEVRHNGIKNPVQYAKRAARSLNTPKRLKAQKEEDNNDNRQATQGASSSDSE